MPPKTKKKHTIYDLLDRIHEKPGFYLGSRTLSSLRDFLCGLSVGQHFSWYAKDDEPDFADFSSWFCHHHQAPRAGPMGWYGAIMDQILDDKLAFDRFFEDLANYRQRTPEFQRQISLHRLRAGSIRRRSVRLHRTDCAWSATEANVAASSMPGGLDSVLGIYIPAFSQSPNHVIGLGRSSELLTLSGTKPKMGQPDSIRPKRTAVARFDSSWSVHRTLTSLPASVPVAVVNL